ncbi:S8 family peptidase [Candidatus Spongiihabitans sp.]|uniref:S8 family peptidase n=1 Tax=Candidatus Spongiihabitans sp. TaxID=3101308 RepID=UPI003C703B06
MVASRPLLIFPSPEPVTRPKGHGGGSEPPSPVSSSERAERISKQFEHIISYIQDAPDDPYHVLVIETVGKTADFHKAVQQINGLEWLAEIDVDDVSLDDLYEEDSDDFKAARKAGGRLYLSSSNQQALNNLESLWQQWKDNKTLDRGFGSWKYLFKYITVLRFWDEKDRLDYTGILDKWKDEVNIKDGTGSECAFEIELQFLRNEEGAARNVDKMVDHIESLEGRVNNRCRIVEIAFHSMKVTVPISAVKHVLKSHENHSNYPDWIRFSGIKYCRPISQQLQTDAELEDNLLEQALTPPTASPPVIALLDGTPLLNHRFLADYIVFDDPDDFASNYNAAEQKHGTCMASLICHNDLSDPDRVSVGRKIYVRPIMFPVDNGQGRIEQIPSVDFAEDLIERAVIRIFDEHEEANAACPTVRVINLSIGNLDQQFIREMSPWAKLLDWLSWKYKVLFIVSAGNFDGEVDTREEDGQLSQKFVQSMERTQIERKLLSPAESINSLTVGAMHLDFSSSEKNRLVNPYKDQHLPAEYSRNGPGYRQQIKPEILVSGGEMLYEQAADKFVPQLRNDIGQRAAYVGVLPEDITNTTHRIGTSNSAALATHAAAHLFEILEELRGETAELTENYDALLLKSLLVHGASWGEMNDQYEVLKNSQNSHRFKRVIAKHLGYGEVNFARVMSCTETRVTILGFGELNQSERHRFNLNIPDAVTGLHIRMVVTLAWFTPINPFRYGIRQAKLFFDVPDFSNTNRQEADWQQVKNGSVQHEIFNINQFTGNQIEIFVQCEADATENLVETIPYAISFTLEAEEETGIDLYEMIEQSIHISV